MRMSPTKQLETTEQVVAAMGDMRRMRILEILTERQASVKELSEIIHESPLLERCRSPPNGEVGLPVTLRRHS